MHFENVKVCQLEEVWHSGLWENTLSGFKRVNGKFRVNKRFSANSDMTVKIKKYATSGGSSHVSENNISVPGVIEKNIRTRLNFLNKKK